MKLGVHLPQAGTQASADKILQHAIRAEALGLADVWVSEHIIVPKDAPYPPTPVFYDPVVVLSWVAAVTRRVGLGTSVLVLPMRHPLPLAKELGTLQELSGGRLILGAGVGWLEAEFAALGVPFRERGRRMDEGIAMMRAVWYNDPVTFEANWIDAKIDNMRMLPRPVVPIPHLDRRHRRAPDCSGASVAGVAWQPPIPGRDFSDCRAVAAGAAGSGIRDLHAHTLGRGGRGGTAVPVGGI